MTNIISRLIILASFVFVSLAPTTAFADSPSFTYIEAEYIAGGDIEVADGSLSASLDVDGFAINASVELGIFLLQASRFELESDELLGAQLEDSISSIAVGVTFALPKTAVYGLIRGRRDELSLRGAGLEEEEDGNSVGLEAGVRFNVTDRFELNANIGSPALDEGTSYGVGAQFYVSKNLGLTVDFSSIEIEEKDITANLDITSIGLRYNF
jgi:hypothetical protein